MLAAAAAAGDRDALEQVCRQLQRDVWRHCRRVLHDEELTSEAAQDTFLRLVTAIRRWRGDGSVEAYTAVLATRAAARVAEREARPRMLLILAPSSVDHDTGLVELEQLVAGLPAPLRDAFVLTQIVECGYEEAANVLGCPIGTIRSRVHRARAHLVAALTADGPRPPEGSEPMPSNGPPRVRPHRHEESP